MQNTNKNIKRNFIFHIDMDSFFPSIEENRNPNYKDKPLIVGGRDKHGVVSSANYEARKYGIKAAMPIYMAKQLCPNLIIADHNMDDYVYFSNQIYNFLKTNISKTIEYGSIDEWYLDIKDSKLINLTNTEIVSYIKINIKKIFNLNCTIGVSYNKFLAKMATNQAKPNGYLEISHYNFKDYIWNLDIKEMIFLGVKTVPILNSKKIFKIKDIALYKNNEEMIKLIGISWTKFKNNSLGIDNDYINPNTTQKSIGKSYSSPSCYTISEVKSLCYKICDKLEESINQQNILYKTFTIVFKNQEKISKTFSKSFDDYKKTLNAEFIFNFFIKNIGDNKNILVKMFSIQISNLKENFFYHEQLNLFNNEQNNNNTSLNIANKLNEHFKKRIIFLGKEKI